VLKTLLTRYFIATGFIVNLAVAVVGVMLAPGLVSRVFEAAETVDPGTWEQARASIKTWSAHTNSGLGNAKIRVDGREVPTLSDAADAMRDGSILEIGEGVYTEALIIRPDNTRVVGRGHVVFEKAAAKGKATFIVEGSGTTIENIECRKVAVRDGNGACVRLEGKDLSLEHVYFHSSQQGLLTGSKPGHVRIRDSYFERLGNRGQAHGIYVGGGILSIDQSYILGAKSEGHEIKSRATHTTISRSVIASLNAKDSRLVDISNGGIVKITDSTLQQGPNSANSDMIGFALEKRRHKENALVVQRNIIILERNGPNRLLHSRAKEMSPDISDNIVVTPKETAFKSTNLEYRRRAEAGLTAYPAVPMPLE